MITWKLKDPLYRLNKISSFTVHSIAKSPDRWSLKSQLESIFADNKDILGELTATLGGIVYKSRGTSFISQKNTVYYFHLQWILLTGPLAEGRLPEAVHTHGTKRENNGQKANDQE